MYFHVGEAQAYVLEHEGSAPVAGPPVFTPVRPDVLTA
jgi:carbonic anhydrase